MVKTFSCKLPIDLHEPCLEIGARFKKSGGSLVVFLEGDLGAGKTELVRQYLSLGTLAGEVMSPTFAMINEYSDKSGERVVHVDLYRSETKDEIESSGFWELFEESGLFFIEWPSRLDEHYGGRGLFPSGMQTVHVKIEIAEDGSRKVIVA